jgi:Domain of unknown function (DUF1841)
MSLFTGHDRDAMRSAWRAAWGRHVKRLLLTPLQAQMVEVIALHPEYHAQLGENPELAARIDEDPEAASQIFLHLGLHLALREQLATDRPKGIAQIHRRLSAGHGEAHQTEHRMMGALEQALWQAQRAGHLPDETLYFEALRRL